MRHASIFCALLLAACKTAAPVPEALAEKFTPTGEIAFQGVGATFDASRVVGPKVNMTLRTDGSWAGMLKERPEDVSVYSSRAVGVDLTLSWESTGEGMVVTGQERGLIYRFEITGDTVTIRTPNRSFDMKRFDENSFGPQGQLVLKGDAGKKAPPMPQWGLAMMGAF